MRLTLLAQAKRLGDLLHQRPKIFLDEHPPTLFRDRFQYLVVNLPKMQALGLCAKLRMRSKLEVQRLSQQVFHRALQIARGRRLQIQTRVERLKRVAQLVRGVDGFALAAPDAIRRFGVLLHAFMERAALVFQQRACRHPVLR